MGTGGQKSTGDFVQMNFDSDLAPIKGIRSVGDETIEVANESARLTNNLDGKFVNKKLMFTGGFQNMSRSEAKSIAENNGGKVIGSVSKKLDILICSAGITGPNKKTWEYTEKEWEYVFDVNTNGTFFANKACIPLMIKNGYGRIVNISSIAGKEGNPNAAAYSSSKAAVIGLTKSLGKELSTYPITVNCVTPAAVKTEIFDQMTNDHINYMLSKIPMGRFGTIDEVSSLVCWLVSSECSFSTGGVFDISGGRATY